MTTRRIGPKGRALIKEFEGCHKRRPDGRYSAYPDPGSGGDPWTIGWGSTGPDVTPSTIWTQQQCDDRFDTDVQKFAAKVSGLLGDAATTPGQFSAIVSLAYNVGIGNLRSSTLLRKHKAGDFAGAGAEFARWNKAAGKVMPGLTRRRAAEAALYRLSA
jgi:lysozyme